MQAIRSIVVWFYRQIKISSIFDRRNNFDSNDAEDLYCAMFD